MHPHGNVYLKFNVIPSKYKKNMMQIIMPLGVEIVFKLEDRRMGIVENKRRVQLHRSMTMMNGFF